MLSLWCCASNESEHAAGEKSSFQHGSCMVKESQCAVQKHCSFMCVKQPGRDTHLHAHTDCSAEPTSLTSHTSNLDQHALGLLKIAQRSHCGLPLCEVGRDVIKTLGVISPPPDSMTAGQPRGFTTRHHWPTSSHYIAQKYYITHAQKMCSRFFFFSFYIQLCDFIHMSENVMVSLGGN